MEDRLSTPLAPLRRSTEPRAFDQGRDRFYSPTPLRLVPRFPLPSSCLSPAHCRARDSTLPDDVTVRGCYRRRDLRRWSRWREMGGNALTPYHRPPKSRGYV